MVLVCGGMQAAHSLKRAGYTSIAEDSKGFIVENAITKKNACEVKNERIETTKP